MTGPEFAALLARAGLRQRDVPALVKALAGAAVPHANTVSRYCRGGLPVDPVLVALIELYRRCPAPLRETLLAPAD